MRGLGSDANLWKSEVSLDKYFHLSEDLLSAAPGIYLGLGGGLAVPFDEEEGTVNYGERFFFGGSRFGRGFRFRGVGPYEGAYPLGGATFVRATAEYRVPLYPQPVPGPPRRRPAGGCGARRCLSRGTARPARRRCRANSTQNRTRKPRNYSSTSGNPAPASRAARRAPWGRASPASVRRGPVGGRGSDEEMDVVAADPFLEFRRRLCGHAAAATRPVNLDEVVHALPLPPERAARGATSAAHRVARAPRVRAAGGDG